MSRIVVEPEALQALGGRLSQTADQLLRQQQRLRFSLYAIDWESRHEARLVVDVDAVAERGIALARRLEALGRWVLRKAEAFAEADRGWDGPAGLGTSASRGPKYRPSLGLAAVPMTPLLGTLLGPAGLAVAQLFSGSLRWYRGLVEGELLLGWPGAAPPWGAGPRLGPNPPGARLDPVPPGAQTGPRVVPMPVPPGPAGEQLPTPEQVDFIQQVLGIEEDGYGPRTRAAVADFQRRQGIPVDSQVMIGPLTWTALLGLAYTQGMLPRTVGFTVPGGAAPVVPRSPGIRAQVADPTRSARPPGAPTGPAAGGTGTRGEAGGSPPAGGQATGTGPTVPITDDRAGLPVQPEVTSRPGERSPQRYD